MDRSDLLEALRGATDRLVATAERLDAAAMGAASLLATWSRGHVLSHVARNADGLRSLLLSARSGEPLRMYASLATRDADIEAGAGRAAEVIVADLAESGRRFVVEAGAMPVEAWPRTILHSSGQPNPREMPAERCLALRLQEVEVHHGDLGAGYGFADTPAELASFLLAGLAERNGVRVTSEQGGSVGLVIGDAEDGPRCEGARADVLAWLAGRSDGTGVRGEAGTLPDLPGLP